MEHFVSAGESYLEAVKTKILDSLFTKCDNIDAVSISIINKVTDDINYVIDNSDQAVLEWRTRLGEGIYNLYNTAVNELDVYQKKVIDQLGADATDTELVTAAIKNDISDALDKYSVVIVDGVSTIILKAGYQPPAPAEVVTPAPAADLGGIVSAIGAIPAALTGISKAVALFGKIGELGDLMHSPESSILEMGKIANMRPGAEQNIALQSVMTGVSAMGMITGSPAGILPFFSSVFSSGLGEIFNQAARAVFKPSKLGLAELVTGYIRNEIDLVKLMDDASAQGFSMPDVEVSVRLARQLIPINDTMALWLRGELKETELDSRLSEMGLLKDDIAKLKSLSYVIPQVNDLIHMAVRETFTPEIAEKFGQYQDFPPALAEWGAKQGLSAEWAQRYWAAHWELPGAQLGFEMLHRGVITGSELTMLLRALDVMPFWRDKLTAIAYTPYTRVDIRRMHKMGLLNRDEVVRAHLDIGYDADKAEKLTQFTTDLNKEEVKLEKQAERDLTASEITNAYANSAIGESETRTMLTDLGYDTHEIELKLILAELPVLKRIRDKKIAIVNQRLLYGAIDLNGAVDALGALDMPSNEMEFTLADWQLDLELQALKAEAARAKSAATKKATAGS